MEICDMCKEQIKKSYNAKPHEFLRQVDEERIFKGVKPRGYKEQDYQCLMCQAKFTQSTCKNDLPWTLWQG